MEFEMMLSTMGHVKTLETHGAKVVDTMTGIVRDVNLDLFYDAMRILHEHGARAIGYDLMIPETDETLVIYFWKDGRVWTGSADTIHAMLDNEWRMRKGA